MNLEIRWKDVAPLLDYIALCRADHEFGRDPRKTAFDTKHMKTSTRPSFPSWCKLPIAAVPLTIRTTRCKMQQLVNKSVYTWHSLDEDFEWILVGSNEVNAYASHKKRMSILWVKWKAYCFDNGGTLFLWTKFRLYWWSIHATRHHSIHKFFLCKMSQMWIYVLRRSIRRRLPK